MASRSKSSLRERDVPDPVLPSIAGLLETEELLVFSRVVAKRSLAAAAIELGMPRATVSRRLALLERKVGVRLLRRTTRSMTVTDAGRELVRHAELVIQAAMEAARSVRGSTRELARSPSSMRNAS